MYILHLTVLLNIDSSFFAFKVCVIVVNWRNTKACTNATIMLTKMLSPFGFCLDYFAWQNMPINFIPNQNIFILTFPYQKETMEPTFQVANDWFTEAFSTTKKKKIVEICHMKLPRIWHILMHYQLPENGCQ